ncbi:MAG TPA: substrate-binding domain-containing protein [Luteolibacter sp.]
MSVSPTRLLSLTDQAAEHLRGGIRAGRWKHRLPGEHKLAADLGVSHSTVARAVACLVAEGALARTGARQAYTIVSPQEPPPVGPCMLRIALLRVTPAEKTDPSMLAQIQNIRNQVKAAGHTCELVTLPAGKDTHKTGYLPRLLKETDADAWFIYMGTVEILEWFIARDVRAFALGGRCRDLPIACVAHDPVSLIQESIRRLVALNHRRIVLISLHENRNPTPSRKILAFRSELELAGVKPGEYHTPDWEETPEGLAVLLESLFRVTPPTALVCANPNTTSATLAFLARRGTNIPGHVSLVSLEETEPSWNWIFPGMRIAQPRISDAPIHRRIREWVENVAAGTPDARQTWLPMKFDEGTTVGPARTG